MRTIARLAWRNLWRQRRRTLLLVVVVAYATLAIVFFWGFTDGFLQSILANQGRLVSAPVLVAEAAWFDDPDPQNALRDPDPVLEAALDHPAVREAAPRLEVAALLRSPYATEGAQLRGVDPAREASVSLLPERIGDGRMLAARGEIVLGRALAERLDVRLDERLAVDVASVGGPRAVGLRLVGIVDAGMAVVDETVALVHLDEARALSGVATATGLALDVRFGDEDAVARSLAAVLPAGVEARSVMQLLGPLQRGLASERTQMIPLGLLFSLFAAVTVTTTVVVSVLERTREFGVIAALGLDQAALGWMVTLESVFATALGGVVGAALGYGLNWTLSTWNLLGPVFGSLYGDLLEGLAVSDEIYAATSLEYLAYASVTIALAALFAVLAPARRVRRLEPAAAMRAD